MAPTEPVLFITQHFAPEQIGSAPYCVDIAKWLVDAGFSVQVMTGQPAYPSAEAHAEFRRQKRLRERTFGFMVTRLDTRSAPDGTVGRRVLGELEFLARGIGALIAGRVRRCRTVLTLSPSVFSVALGVLACRRGGRHVAIVHDIQSGLANGLGMVRNRRLLALMRFVERVILNRVDVVAVLTDEMADQLRVLGVRRPIEVLPLWVDTEAIVPVGDLSAGNTVLYSGNMGRKQGLDQILDLAEGLRERAVEATVLVRGGGNRENEFQAQVVNRRLENIRVAPLLPESELNRGLADGDVHLVPQNPDAADFAMPSKVFNIMAAGRPFVATARPGSALWRLQQRSQAFLCIEPNDPSAFADAVASLLGDPGRRARLGAAGRAYVLAEHGRQVVLSRLGRLLEGVAAPEETHDGVVVLEPSHEGHPLEWLEHIVRFALGERLPEPLRLVVAPELHDRLAALVPDEQADRVSVTALLPREKAVCLHRSLVVSGFARWWIMRRYLRRFGARRGHFLSLDHLSLPLALGLGANGCVIDGVLFRPSVHYRELGDYSPAWRERIRDLRKSVLYRLMLLNNSVESVLTLDPFFARYAVGRYRRGEKVRPLPDPICRHDDRFVPPIARGGSGRVRFLLFGYLAERKGVMHLVTALAYLDSTTASRISVTIAGSVDPKIREKLRHSMRDVRHLQPTIRLHLEEGRLSQSELEKRIDESDVVLAPYQRFVGSSGVLIWAAAAGKPVLTQNFGLLNRLTVDYGLGVTADTTEPQHLARAIEHMVREGPRSHFDAALAAQFVRERTPSMFAAGVLRRAM